MRISSEIFEKFGLEPEAIKDGKTKCRLFNHYSIELVEREGKLLYEVVWENWGRRVQFSEGELTDEKDLLYFIEYTESCVSIYE